MRMTAFALLLLPAFANADTISIDWTGQIVSYGATPDSGFPQGPLSTSAISGNLTYDTSLLPAPDAGNPPGVFSFSGGGLIQSTAPWGRRGVLPDLLRGTTSSGF